MPVQLIQAAYLPRPATCISCGATDRTCLDFGANVERFGAILLCTLCVSYATTAFGEALNVAPLSENIRLQMELTAAEARLAEVPRALEVLRAAVDAAGQQFDSQLRSPVLVVREPEEPAEPIPAREEPAPPVRKPRGGRGKADRPDPAPVGPADSAGPDDVPGDQGDTSVRDFAFDF